MQIKLKNLTSFSKFLYSLSTDLIFMNKMKKLLLIILGLLPIFFVYSNYVESVSVSDFTPSLDKKIASMKTTEEKVKYLQSFSDLLASPKFTKDKNAKLFAGIREYSLNMLKVFESELREEQAKNNSNKSETYNAGNFTQSTKNLPHLSDNFWNIDVQAVRKAVLTRHNEERKSVWVGYYTYNLDLEWSATVWANKLADSHKTSNLHPRNPGDWYYNYDSMQNRFSGLWIKFSKAPKWAAAFSETIWYGYYKCSKSDCTQDLIDAVKKTRTWLIMKEKSSGGSHYKAATMKHFTQMWAWVAIDKTNNRYYVVLHYWVDI